MKLICFTYAGGTSSFYDRLKNELLPDIEPVAIEYSGHGKRHKAPFYSDFEELVQDVAKQIEDILDSEETYAIMGYSMGSISAVEVLRYIEERKKKLPVHIFLAAHEPKTKSELKDYNSGENDELVKQRTIKFGGLPERLLNNDSFWRMYLPIYRADYSIIGKYDFDKLKLISSVPATVFYSEKDTPYSEMKEWSKYFPKSCEYISYEGNHFFINDHLFEMVDVIKNRLVN